MKKITFLFVLFSFAATAQSFPNPYCDISVYFDIEEITSIDFNGTQITNANTGSVLIDKTATVVNVTAGQPYTIEVQGNSYGEYDNEYAAYIDFNHNNILDDAGEMFYIGLIYDSDGYDGASATATINIPLDALSGSTRIRIVKVYTDAAFDFTLNADPCSITAYDEFAEEVSESYGQAIDFTLNVAPLGVRDFNKNALLVYPNPTTDMLNVAYESDISEIKIYNLLGQQVLSKEVGSASGRIDVESLSAGTYIVKLFSADAQHSLKLIKQ